MIHIIELNRMIESINGRDFDLLSDYILTEDCLDDEKFKSFSSDSVFSKVNINNYGLSDNVDLYFIKEEVEEFIQVIKQYHQELSTRIAFATDKNKLQNTIIKSVAYLNEIKKMSEQIKEDIAPQESYRIVSNVMKCGYKIVLLYVQYEGLLNKIDKCKGIDYSKALDLYKYNIDGDALYSKLIKNYTEANGILAMFKKFLDLVKDRKNVNNKEELINYVNKITCAVSDISSFTDVLVLKNKAI